MHKLLMLLARHQINLDDCYGFVLEAKTQATLVLGAEKHSLLEEVLQAHDYQLLSEAKALHGLSKGSGAQLCRGKKQK